MRLLGLLIVFGFTLPLSAETTCKTYGLKAVQCYELGQLATTYDEAGVPCGNRSSEVSFWNVKKFDARYAEVKTVEELEETFPGGSSVEAVCEVSFVNVRGDICSFSLDLSLGDEDAEAGIFDLKCTRIEKY
ncbi:MAG: hypothetical protein CL677_10625 [Bdellovibrionaceae bacterium]|nr:hypothetical protein [Pseudobdellovibrionaceae bacterium]|tara:strand:- start:37333 stop:37728 length:396 start_codon:yes stop_codon:yes gene_type:complete